MDKKKAKIIIIISNILYGCILPVAIFQAIFSIMLASGGSSVRVYIQIYSLLTLPFVLGFSIVVPWILYGFKLYRTAIGMVLVPFINGILILIFVAPGW